MHAALRSTCSTLVILLLGSTQAFAQSGSVEFFINGQNDYDYGVLTDIPAGFGSGEFTFELWIRPNDSFPVGSVTGGANQLTNWSNVDNAPYSSSTWWFAGNFLLDGHNNNSGSQNGTFSLQFYGGGRVRWLFGDGVNVQPGGGHWSVGAYPASNSPDLLDGAWHQVTLVRRWVGSGNDAQLELWIDGNMVAQETSSARTDMRQWWNNWSGFGSNQQGWFFGAEKQAAINQLLQYEDYKGLVDEMRFWDFAKTSADIAANYNQPVGNSTPGLVGKFTFNESQGTSVCDTLNASACITLINPNGNVWSASEAPLAGGGGDTTPPTVPAGLQATAISSSQINLSWMASSDDTGVSDYVIRRDGAVVGTTSQLTFADTGLAPSTTYSYTVSARDAAGNTSAQSASESATTQASSDTTPPSVPGNLQGSAVSASEIDLTWNASTDNVGVTGYDVFRDGANVATTTQPQYSDTGLTASTTYSYTIRARDAAGNTSGLSSAASVTTQTSSDGIPPSVPGNLQGTAVSASRIDLTWNASSDNVGVTGYDVFRDGANVATTTQPQYSDTGLTASTTYSYTVRARDAAGNTSGLSSAASVTTQTSSDTTPPSVPGNLQGSAVSASEIDLTWNPSTDNVAVTGYDVFRDGANVATTTQLQYSDTGLSASSTYTYTVRARDAAGNISGQSSSTSVTTLAGSDTVAPSVPGNLQGNATSTSVVSLSWTASTDNVAVTGYDVFRDGINIASTAQTTFSDTGRSANASYVYTVRARDAAGNVSANSSPVSVVTLSNPAPPPADSGGGGGSFGGSLLLLFLALLRRRIL